MLALISPYVHTSTRLYAPRTCSHQQCTYSQPMLHIFFLFTPKCVTFWCENTRSHFSVGKTASSGTRLQDCPVGGLHTPDLPKVLALISHYVHTSTRLYTPRTCSHQRCTHSQPMLHICLLFTPKCVTFWCENTRSCFSVGKTAFSGTRLQDCP